MGWVFRFSALSFSVVLAAFLFLIPDSAWGQVDHTKSAVVLPFESSVETKPGFLDLCYDIVVTYLKDDRTFATVLNSAEAEGKQKSNMVEIAAKLVEFKAGSMATRIFVGFGSGRASAAFEFTVKDTQTGNAVWKKKIKEKASFWSNSASSTAQRMELPEKIAQTLVKELRGKRK